MQIKHKSISILTALLSSSSAAAAGNANANYYDYRPFTNRVPILSKQRRAKSYHPSLSSSSLRLRSSPAIQLSGGGQDSFVDMNDCDYEDERDDDELLAFAEESDIMVEIRGGGGSVATATATSSASSSATVSIDDNVNGSTSTIMGEYQHEHEHEHVRPTQPLRISTYRKGIRQLRNSERREQRRIKRLEKVERRAMRREERRRALEENGYLVDEDGSTTCSIVGGDKSTHKQIAKKLKNRNNLNIRRKVMHATFGLFFSLMNQILPRNIMLPSMTLVTSSTLLIELLRYRKGFAWMNDALHFVLGGTLRKQEMEGKFTGAFYYFLGVTLTSYLFPQSCATLGICQLALADPSASFFGRQTRHVYWSRIENGFFGIGRNKGILGFLGGAAFCFPFNYYVLNISKFGGSDYIPGGQSSVALASIALGLAGAFADLCVPTPALTMPKKIMGIPMPRFHVDDNVVVPIVSGYACTKIFDFLGWTTTQGVGVDLKKLILF